MTKVKVDVMAENYHVKFFFTQLFISFVLTAELPSCERRISENGFHRELTTRLLIPDELMPDVIPGGDVNCFMLFEETVPSGTYVDPYQLKSLRRFDGPDVLISQPFDLEKPEFKSGEIPVFVYTNLSHTDGAWMTNYTLPVHIRYHAISEELDFAYIAFKHPTVAIRCQVIEYGMQYIGYRGPTSRQASLLCGTDTILLCDWTVISVNLNVEKLTARVPVGKKEHKYLVTIGTVLATFSGCLILICKALRSKCFKVTKVS